MKNIHFLFTASTLVLGLHTSVFSQNWVLGGNNVTANSLLGTNTNYALVFETNNVERGRISNAGNWGLGIATPGAKLHVNSVAGTHPFTASVANSLKFIIATNGRVGIGTNAPAQILHVNGNEILSTGPNAGFKFRNRGSTSTSDDWVWYTKDNIARFYKVGPGDLLGVSPTGQLSVGTITPGIYKFKVRHGTYGIAIESAVANNFWELYVAGGLNLVFGTSFRGTFNSSTGAYSSVSDERMKTNIKEMPSVLQKVNQLKPRTYRFKSAAETDTTSSMGFVAQEILKVFPGLVTHTVNKERGEEYYSLDYSGFGVIAIKAIQELQKTNDKQLEKIEMLENRLAKIEAAVGNMTSGVNKDVGAASLDQNYPNPFSDVTTFNYSIPFGAIAQIRVYDLGSGEMVKSIQVNESGKFQLSASELKPGLYNCTLFVNGEVVASKKMMVNK